METTQVLGVLAILFVFAPREGHCLQCYVCNGCVDIKDAQTQTCPNATVSGSEPRCMKQIAGGVLARSCGLKPACDIFKKNTGICDGNSLKQTCGICCDTDKCNSATNTQISAIVLMVAAAVHKLLF